jgi:hypothetical protein
MCRHESKSKIWQPPSLLHFDPSLPKNVSLYSTIAVGATHSIVNYLSSVALRSHNLPLLVSSNSHDPPSMLLAASFSPIMDAQIFFIIYFIPFFFLYG